MQKIFFELYNANSAIQMPYKKSNLEVNTGFDNTNIVVFRVVFEVDSLGTDFAGNIISVEYHVAIHFMTVCV